MGPDGAYALGDGVTPPTPLTRIAPEVSDLAKRLFAQGDVLLSVVVKSDATLQDIRVVRSVGYGMDESAINTLRKWRFRPGSKDGMPVDVRIKVELAYRLAPDAKR